MRIFIDEFLTSGGLFQRPGWGDCQSLAREGAAMVRAIAADFAALSGVDVRLKRDARLSGLRFPDCRVTDVRCAAEDRAEFQRLAAAADWTLVIAPEIDGMLLQRCQHAVAAGGRLLGPSLEMIGWASDKQRTAEFCSQHGIAVPTGIRLEAGQSLPTVFAYPAVLKPRDGAGSMDIHWIADVRQAAQACPARPARLEEYCPGQPCSVSLVCGKQGAMPLPPFLQRLSQDGQFRYLGGERLQTPSLAIRAEHLARRAARCFASEIGYVGIDLVLGLADNGSQDRLIEINPRLTTSYLGLRHSVRGNLAGALLAVAQEQPVRIEPTDGPIAFAADGSVSDFDSLTSVT